MLSEVSSFENVSEANIIIQCVNHPHKHLRCDDGLTFNFSTSGSLKRLLENKKDHTNRASCLSSSANQVVVVNEQVRFE